MNERKPSRSVGFSARATFWDIFDDLKKLSKNRAYPHHPPQPDVALMANGLFCQKIFPQMTVKTVTNSIIIIA
jgi:hypothetical protein